MGDLTKNLSRHEFACECGCGFDTADFELVHALQDACDYFADVYDTEISIKITGPNRCKEHNEKIQKQYNPDYVPYSSKTQHMYGRAADHKFFIKGTTEQIDVTDIFLYYEIAYEGKWGIGRYDNRTHLDTRTNGPARWDSRTKGK